eukprot:5477871-Pleurochrysis_carterae.AAC.1
MPHRVPCALIPRRTSRLRGTQCPGDNLLVAFCLLHLHLRSVSACRMFCKMRLRRALPLTERSVLDAFPLLLMNMAGATRL